MLLSFISVPRQCVFHFKSEGHWWAWGDYVVVSELFSTSVRHPFQKSASSVGFLVSTGLQRLFGWLRLFGLNSSLIINLFNFFSSSMACTHVLTFECVWGALLEGVRRNPPLWVPLEPRCARVYNA